MKAQGSNLTEVRRIKPTMNRADYEAIISGNLNSVSQFSQASVVIPELNSISQPSLLKEEHKREA